MIYYVIKNNNVIGILKKKKKKITTLPIVARGQLTIALSTVVYPLKSTVNRSRDRSDGGEVQYALRYVFYYSYYTVRVCALVSFKTSPREHRFCGFRSVSTRTPRSRTVRAGLDGKCICLNAVRSFLVVHKK